ncbi:hypothetical protein F2P56_014049 [Juglans regia]|uniref:UPF0496 protein At4g34320-like n=2 Tax=Juglans regia TaxID=51240 RepID=A0A2I4F3X1_JUGRE|nr:UPF0496 protein At4g34320-like [Juglans regia]XP_018826350.1 UPF0496 protein At4g34320-like [Juglans regia]XP_018826351.1 UPF0496 protein At4g34320-like [Juglans regia]XP_018826352.1 UPF0496 protein At4g34320-like [Juglans regia]XP_035547667.1 UPF0496 protein At4g34320-like [Juglans regia]KAF5463926.1 hypothetical protein F2P56_014049 [Juglans regia]
MGSNSSKTHFKADMRAHEVAGELDVDLESGDVTVVVEPQLVSSDSIKEIVKCLYEMDREMANFNLKCREDIWNNQEFFSLLKDYFQNSLRALDFCTALEDCLERTRDNLSIVQSANTLQELRQFRDAEDPFTNEFSQLLRSVSEQHELMLDKLKPWKTKLDKKLETVQPRSIVFIVIFVFSGLFVLALMVVPAGIKAPAWANPLASALAVPIFPVCKSLWGRYQSALEGKKGVISSMRYGTLTAKKDLGNIEALIRKLRNETRSILDNVDLALGEEVEVTLVIDEIQKKLEMFMNTAQNLRDNGDRCSGNSVSRRKSVLRSMFRRARD